MEDILESLVGDIWDEEQESDGSAAGETNKAEAPPAEQSKAAFHAEGKEVTGA